MKNQPEPHRDDPLLDAVLRDDSWTQISAAAKSAALAEFRMRQRRRQITFWSAQAAAAVMVVTGAAWWLHPHAGSNPPPATARTVAAMPAQPPPVVVPDVAPSAAVNPPAASTPSSYISEAEMVALFPKGSCEVVEINGTKQLVFYDRKVELEGAIYQPRG